MNFLIMVWGKVINLFRIPRKTEALEQCDADDVKGTVTVKTKKNTEHASVEDSAILKDEDDDWWLELMVGPANVSTLKRIAAERNISAGAMLNERSLWGLSMGEYTNLSVKQLSKIQVIGKNKKILKELFEGVRGSKSAEDTIVSCRIDVLSRPYDMFESAEEHKAYLDLIELNTAIETREQEKKYAKLYSEDRVNDKIETLELLRGYNHAPPRVEVLGHDRRGNTLTKYNSWVGIKPHPIKKYLIIDNAIGTTNIYGTKGIPNVNTADFLKIPAAIGFYGNNGCKFTGFKAMGRKVRGVYFPGNVKETWVVHTKEIKPGGRMEFDAAVVAEYDNNKFLPVAEKADHMHDISFKAQIKNTKMLFGVFIDYMLKMRNVWTIEITDKESGVTMIFPAGMHVIKELCKLRDNPLTEKGNKKHLLHTVASHSRITSAGTNTVKRYLRGIYSFEMCGYDIMVSPPAVEFINASEKKIEKFSGTLPWYLYKHLPEDTLVTDYLKLINSVKVDSGIEYRGRNYDLSRLSLPDKGSAMENIPGTNNATKKLPDGFMNVVEKDALNILENEKGDG